MTVQARWWQAANLLSLDAPVVAVLWQALLQQVTGTMLLPAGRWALGLTVWAIYLADRLLDVRDGRRAPRTARHEFTRRHWRWMAALLGVVLAADAVTVVRMLRAEVMHTGLVTAAGVAVYLAVLNVGGDRRWFPKEEIVAALFTAGVFLVAWTNGEGRRGELVSYAAGFYAVVLANLLAVESEAPGRWYGWALGAFIVGCAALGEGAWWWPVGVSAAGLWVLDLARGRVRGEARRLALDVAMLSPLVFLR
ncbi:MAG: hypothetical protein ABI972_18635 [Acidobacteriota bacterium]